MVGFIASGARALAAIVAAMLPRRWWPLLDDFVPASSAAWAASLLTLLAGAALGFTGFFAHVEAAVSLNNAAYLEAATRVRGDEMPLPSALSMLSLFTFVFLTPQGWASTYLVLSGFVRALGSRFDDPHGDFILTLADAGLRKVAGRTALARTEGRRHGQEGPEVPDRAVRGAQVGIPNAPVVIVSSRIKPDWDLNAVVLTDRGEFRIVHAEDREIGGRLRRLYALAPHHDLEVFRRAVHYQFPSGPFPGAGETDASSTRNA